MSNIIKIIAPSVKMIMQEQLFGIDCETIATGLNEPLAIQIDEEHNALYVLTNYKLTRINLNNNENNVEVVYQHNIRFGENNMNINDDNDEYYSQGESDNEEEMPRVSDPFEDSEPSTDDDEEKVTNRRNWRRYGWRIYQLDNPCSILFLSEQNQLIVLNEGVITFLKIQIENNRPFVSSPSKNIFCYDFDIFNENGKKQSIQPWSITSTLIDKYFIFSLLDNGQLYSLDMRNDENIIIEKYLNTEIHNCPYLIFHSQSNKIFVYNSNQIFSISVDDRTIIKIDLPFIEKDKTISTITIDKNGLIYIISDSKLFQCNYHQLQIQLIQCLGIIQVNMDYPQMIITKTDNQFYFSDIGTNSVYRWKKQ
ncbi:unnamed protein product [Adineta steineri]|uniref:Uncharacterized protein n=1 Tax=Adineta steineri TaxID=433720 RepID=A0A818ITB5_9BILA|nr:unnamed protein product [Adineta steineri]CAF3529536.1 unnamed protein product [Adineta steineri]